MGLGKRIIGTPGGESTLIIEAVGAFEET